MVLSVRVHKTFYEVEVLRSLLLMGRFRVVGLLSSVAFRVFGGFMVQRIWGVTAWSFARVSDPVSRGSKRMSTKITPFRVCLSPPVLPLWFLGVSS